MYVAKKMPKLCEHSEYVMIGPVSVSVSGCSMARVFGLVLLSSLLEVRSVHDCVFALGDHSFDLNPLDAEYAPP